MFGGREMDPAERLITIKRSMRILVNNSRSYCKADKNLIDGDEIGCLSIEC
jgi:hypothetical protein